MLQNSGSGQISDSGAESDTTTENNQTTAVKSQPAGVIVADLPYFQKSLFLTICSVSRNV